MPGMDVLDRLEWAAGLAIVRYGVRVGMRASEAPLLDGVADYLPPGSHLSRAPAVDCLLSLVRDRSVTSRAVTALYANAELMVRTADRRLMLSVIESAARFAVASRTRQRLFVHAGVVGHRGRALVFPGPSGAGKTEIVAALVRAGGIYYSDEFAVFDEAGWVHPYASPLRLSTPTGGLKTRRPVETLPGVAGTTAIPVGLIVEAHYAPGDRWRPRRLSAGEAVLALLHPYGPVPAVATEGPRRPGAGRGPSQRPSGPTWRGLEYRGVAARPPVAGVTLAPVSVRGSDRRGRPGSEAARSACGAGCPTAVPPRPCHGSSAFTRPPAARPASPWPD